MAYNVNRNCVNCSRVFTKATKKNQKCCSVACAKSFIGKSRVGIKRPPSVGLKVSQARKGMKFSKEHTENMRKARTGVKRNPALPPYRHTPEMRLKMSLLRRGEKSRFWEGGISSIIRLVRRSTKYKLWRESVYKRDNFTCTECREHDKYLNADHIIQFSFLMRKYNIKTVEESDNCEGLWDIKNGRTLCIDCHKRTDTYLNKGKVNLQKICLTA